MTETLVLYDYWRSSAAYRVRITLNLKGLAYTSEPVHLVRGGGEQHGEEYRAINPQGRVPALRHGQQVLTQSLAICGYLDALSPEPPILPQPAADRAWVRSVAQTIACDIHPLNNLGVMQYLKGELGAEESDIAAWYATWVGRGFTAIEQQLADGPASGLCCYGDQPTLADICLIPQVYNAERFKCDLEPYPKIRKITAYCRSLEAFAKAAPEAQADAS